MMPLRNNSIVKIIVALILAVAMLPVGTAGADLPAGTGPDAALSAVSGSETTVQQFTADGHVLGFGEKEVYLAGLGHALRLEFVGGSAVAPITESGGPAANRVAPLGRVHYSGTWPGIDVIFSAVEGGIAESTYIIHPGGDPADISLRYNVPTEIMPEGGLHLAFENGYMTESPPIAWQEIDGRQLSVAVQLEQQAENQVGFSLGSYDPAHAVYIDPVYQWHTFYGGASHDVGNGIAVDSSGNIYIAGESDATWNGPGNKAPLNPHSGGDSADIVIVKLNSSGTYQWHTFYGGADIDVGSGIAVDSSGNIYVTGESRLSWNGPGNTAPLNSHTGHSSVVIVKLDSSGTYQWHTFYGGESWDAGYGISVDSSGNAYVTGQSFATYNRSERIWVAWNGPAGEAPLNPHAGREDIVIVKIDSDGAYQWHTFYGSSLGNKGSAIAVDSEGCVYVTGEGGDWNGPGGEAPLNPHPGGPKVVIVKLDSAGTYQWHTFYGGDYGRNPGNGIALDSSGNVYVTGNSTSFDGPNGEAPLNPYAPVTNPVVVIVKLNNSGAYQWHTFYGAGSDYASGIAVDLEDHVYVTGYSWNAWEGPDGEAPLNPHAIRDNFIILKLDSSGAYRWHTFYGGGLIDQGYGIDVDSSGNVYVTGSSSATWDGPDNVPPLNDLTSYAVRDIAVIKTSGSADQPDPDDPDKDNDANLSALEVVPGTLAPDFTPAITAYAVEVAHDVSSIGVTATLSDSDATMTIDGSAATSGETETVTLGDPGSSTAIEIEVTAADETTKKTYTVTVNRAEEAEAPPTDTVFTPGPLMNAPRMGHNFVTMPDGRVALFGGHTTSFVALDTAEIWDPATPNSFTTLDMLYRHSWPAFTRLADGRYLLAGGCANSGTPRDSAAEIFNPTDNSFSAAGDMVRFRSGAGAATLENNTVLIAGAWWNHNDAHTYGELFNPQTGNFSETGPFSVQRAHAPVMPTTDGNAVILGGVSPTGASVDQPVELYNSATGEISTIQDNLFPDDPGWAVSNDWVHVSFMQKMADGRYLWLARQTEDDVTSYQLFTFDPVSKNIVKFQTNPALPDSSNYRFRFQPVIDQKNNRAYLLAEEPDGGTTPTISLFCVDLDNGVLGQSPNSHQLDYVLLHAGIVLLDDGRLMVSGGSSGNSNFTPVRNTLLIAPSCVASPDDPVESVSISADPPSPSIAGERLTFTATAQGLVSPEYRFYYRSKGGSWVPTGPYSTRNTFTTRTTATGNFEVGVLARSGGSSDAPAMDSIDHTIIAPGQVESVSISADPPSPSIAGERLTFTATAQGGVSPEYRFYYRSKGGSWVPAGPYSTRNTFTTETTATGNFEVGVLARSGGSSDAPAMDTIEHTINRADEPRPPVKEPVLYDEVQVVEDEEESNIVHVSEDRSKITFGELTDYVKGLKVGDIILSDYSPIMDDDGLPETIMSRITAISADGKTFTVKEALLDEVIEEGELSFSSQITFDELLQSLEQADNITVVSYNRAQSLVEFDYTWHYYDDPERKDDITISVTMKYNNDIEIQGDMGFFRGLNHFKIEVENDLDISMECKTQLYSADGGEDHAGESQPLVERVVAESWGPRIWVFKGVYFRPVVEFVIGFDGKVSAEISSGFTYSLKNTSGLEYTKATGWNPIYETSGDFEFNNPTLKGEAELQAYLGMRKKFLAYGSVGSTIGFYPYLKGEIQAEMDYTDPENWTWEYMFSRGIRGDFGSRLKVWKIADIRYELLGRNFSEYAIGYGASGRVFEKDPEKEDSEKEPVRDIKLEITFTSMFGDEVVREVTTDENGYWMAHLLSGEAVVKVISPPDENGRVFYFEPEDDEDAFEEGILSKKTSKANHEMMAATLGFAPEGATVDPEQADSFIFDGESNEEYTFDFQAKNLPDELKEIELDGNVYFTWNFGDGQEDSQGQSDPTPVVDGEASCEIKYTFEPDLESSNIVINLKDSKSGRTLITYRGVVKFGAGPLLSIHNSGEPGSSSDILEYTYISGDEERQGLSEIRFYESTLTAEPNLSESMKDKYPGPYKFIWETDEELEIFYTDIGRPFNDFEKATTFTYEENGLESTLTHTWGPAIVVDAIWGDPYYIYVTVKMYTLEGKHIATAERWVATIFTTTW